MFILDPRPASPVPCAETYHGPTAFSEPEVSLSSAPLGLSELQTRAVRDFVLARRDSIDVYLAFHSFGNKILYPWGHTSRRVPDWRELRGFAEAGRAAIAEAAASSKASDLAGLSVADLVSNYTVGQQSRRGEISSPASTPASRFWGGPIGVEQGDYRHRQISTSRSITDMFSNISYSCISPVLAYLCDVDKVFLLAFVVICEPFSVGTAPDTLYRVAGASDDWARGGAGIKVTENIIPFENIVLAVDLAV